MNPITWPLDFIIFWVVRLSECVLVAFLLTYYSVKGFMAFSKEDKKPLVRAILILIAALCFLFYSATFFLWAFTRKEIKLVIYLNQLVPIALCVLTTVKTINVYKGNCDSKKHFKLYLYSSVILDTIVLAELVAIPFLFKAGRIQ